MENHFEMLMNYILDTEKESFERWCEENGFDRTKTEVKEKHVYGLALLCLEKQLRSSENKHSTESLRS